LSSPIDKVKSGFTAVAHPIETAVSAFENFKSKASAIIHPIENFKSKMSEAKESIETQRNTLQVLTSNYNDAEDKVSALTKAFNESVKKTGTTSEETKKLATELEDAKAEASEAKGKMEDYATGVNKAGKESKEAEGKIGDLAEKLGNGLKAAAKIGTAAISAASGAVVALSKQSVESYAEYEQLVGGVETLFGAGGKSIEEYAESVGKSVDKVQNEYDTLMKSQQAVLDNAEKAYSTAGLSANAYMEMTTSFSASLLQSLEGDTVKAAEYADMAIIDMADNANKMGSDISTIQTALTYRAA
jgi:chromosome segregation ATPase